MDGIKKKSLETSDRPILFNQTQNLNYLSQSTHRRKRDALFIAKEESLLMDKHEKKFNKGKKIRRIFLFSITCLFLLLFGYLSFFTWKTYSISKKINGNSDQTSFMQNMRSIIGNHNLLKGEETGRINILLLGAAGEHKPGGNLTDTIMIMSIDTKANKVALLSLPRDFYVKIPDSSNYTKINSLYPIGIKQNQGADLIKETVEKITSLNINYYLAVDFEAFQKIINDIGGVNIIAERDIYDPTYPGPNYSYQTFQLSKGFHTLDGETALKYVRERHDDPEGDFGRAKRQQQVIQAVKNKMFSMQTFFNVSALNNILNTLGDNIKTDISLNEIGDFITLCKKLDLQNITNVVVDAWKSDSLIKASHVQLGGATAFVLIPRVGNFSEIQELAQNIFNQTEIKRRQEKIAQEDASITIINESGYNQLSSKIKDLLIDKLKIKNVVVVAANHQDFSTTTTITDDSNSSKIYTLDELIKKVPAKLSNNQNPFASKTDLTLILGTDIVDTYKYDDASIEDYNQAQNSEQ